ncbi:endonuclease [Muricauda sp. JGD-17]|uniref:UPF0102 protein GTQ34_11780 n=1 Tax=Flagellimonas ochracea TaxID=2696472 RepID=A0A964TEQ3_9FLAO|nr:YraN family protein [Allomuricauda ochracea]NAY92598.1 endonuclease [Allomuricauda ochracea]
MAKHNEFGTIGEQMAADFLYKKGYRILVKNYRYQHAEVDLIAQQGDVLAIVEVKSRTNSFLEDISSTVNRKKMRLLTLAADNFVQEKNLDVNVRFDVITIIKDMDQYKIEHLEDAFYHF